MPKIIYLLLILALVLMGCTTSQESYDVEKAVEDSNFDYQADQAASDWESEKSASQMDELTDQLYSDQSYSGSQSVCPTGCISQETGCDIKGNISFDK